MAEGEAHESSLSYDEPKRRAQSAAGNAAQVAIINIFGGFDVYQQNKTLVDNNTALVSVMLVTAASKENWRDEVPMAFGGTDEQTAQLIVMIDLYGQAVHEGLDPDALGVFATERGYRSGDAANATPGVETILNQYRKFWDVEVAILKAGGPGFD